MDNAKIRDEVDKMVERRVLSRFSRFSGIPLKTLSGIRLNQSRTAGADRKITRHTARDFMASLPLWNDLLSREASEAEQIIAMRESWKQAKLQARIDKKREKEEQKALARAIRLAKKQEKKK